MPDKWSPSDNDPPAPTRKDAEKARLLEQQREKDAERETERYDNQKPDPTRKS